MLDWQKISSSIVANLGDQGKVTQILSDLETEVTTFNTRFTDLEKTRTEQTGQIDSLQKTNMNLFLKIGSPTSDKVVHTETKMTYEDLLNDWDKGAK